MKNNQLNEKPPRLLKDEDEEIRAYIYQAIEVYSGHALTKEWIFSVVMDLSKGRVNPSSVRKILDDFYLTTLNEEKKIDETSIILMEACIKILFDTECSTLSEAWAQTDQALNKALLFKTIKSHLKNS